MVQRTLLLAVLAGALPTYSIAQTEYQDWKTWRSVVCAMNYPANWVYDNSGRDGTMVIFHAPADSCTSGQGHVSLSIVRAHGLELGAFGQQIERTLERDLSELHVYGSGLGPAGASYHIEYAGLQDGRAAHFRRVIRMARGWVFSLTYAADEEAFDGTLPEAEAMVNSFRTTR